MLLSQAYVSYAPFAYKSPSRRSIALIGYLFCHVPARSLDDISARGWSETPEHAQARYEAHAQAIASVALDAQEPPLRGGRVRTAIELASIAFWESGLDERVDEGHCTPHTCDSGLAWSVYQIHDGGGLTLDGAGWLYASQRSPEWILDHADSVIRGPDLVQDRQLAARVALHLARRSIFVWTTARTVLAHVDFWMAAHPAPVLP